MTALEGMEEKAVDAVNQFVSKLNKPSLAARWTTPSQTGNREILTDVIKDLIEQTSNEPGSVDISRNYHLHMLK
ncbi:MAG: hypothetical protein Ct9H300mP28_29340 [Pseudomonadota bacterium]|nr:MAG: hypothetical protein Ct9H300mP28_29340 [Pseudomonadota bacterium]